MLQNTPSAIPPLDQAYLLWNNPFHARNLNKAMEHAKKGKTPNLDGLSIDFYIQFWKIVGLTSESCPR